MLARGIARGRDRQRAQMALGNQPGQARQRHQIGLQQLAQRRVVEQRARAHAAPAGQGPTQRQQAQPARAAAQHAQCIGAIDMFCVQMTPDMGHLPHREVEVVGAAGQCRGIDRAGRRAGDDRKGVGPMSMPAAAPDMGNGFEHADLVGSAGAAAREQQARERRGRHGHSNPCAAVRQRGGRLGHRRFQCAPRGSSCVQVKPWRAVCAQARALASSAARSAPSSTTSC